MWAILLRRAGEIRPKGLAVRTDDVHHVGPRHDTRRLRNVDPYQYDAWVDFIEVDLTQIPIVGTAGDEKSPGKIDWRRLRKRRR